MDSGPEVDTRTVMETRISQHHVDPTGRSRGHEPAMGAGQPHRPQRAQHMMRYLVPGKCLHCHTPGAVDLTARTVGGGVAVSWQCRHCHQTWPVNVDEQTVERRSGRTDRRRHTRTDRRKRPDRAT